MSDDISPSEYYDVVGEDVRRADSEKMWLRRGIEIGRDAGTLEAKRRVAGFGDTTPREKDLLQHGVAIGQASKLGPSTVFSEERIEQIHREIIQHREGEKPYPDQERKREFRSSKEFRDHADRQLREPVEWTIKEVDAHLVRIQREIDRTPVTPYSNANELRAELKQFRAFSVMLKGASPGVVDLVTRVADYGDPDDFECAKETYESAIDRIGGFIGDMERAGIEVKTGVIAVDPPTYDIENDFEYEHDMEIER
jgi:hypothetical protein